MKQHTLITKNRYTGTIFYAILMLVIFCPAETKGQAIGTSTLVINAAIPQIALIDIEPQGNTSISFIISPAVEAGSQGNGAAITNNTLWLNYTNSRLQNGPFRNVMVEAAGNIPAGISLQVQASPRSGGCGKGVFGTPSGAVTLSNTPKVLITGIGGSHTGDGTGCGHNLTYTLLVTNFELLRHSQNNNLQITYTLADN
jgi:hypothetical protein